MKISRRQWLQAAFLSIGSTKVLASTDTQLNIDQTHNYPGGIVQLRWIKTSSNLPLVKFGLDESTVFDDGEYWRALIGLSLSTLPGDYVIYVKDSGSELPGFSIMFSVEQKRYPVIEITTELPQFKTLPEPLSLLDFTNSVPPKLPFRPPVNKPWESTFGRVFTRPLGAQLSPSSTQDFASLSSNEIHMVVAPQNAIVCRIDQDDELSAARICLDHGRGIYSILDGVHDVTVSLGNGVIAGAVLGRMKPKNDNSSNTSPARTNSSAQIATTAAQFEQTLNWYCLLNHIAIDPLILTAPS